MAAALLPLAQLRRLHAVSFLSAGSAAAVAGVVVLCLRQMAHDAAVRKRAPSVRQFSASLLLLSFRGQCALVPQWLCVEGRIDGTTTPRYVRAFCPSERLTACLLIDSCKRLRVQQPQRGFASHRTTFLERARGSAIITTPGAWPILPS